MVGHHLDETGQPWILNLASAEYSRPPSRIPSDMVTCQFLEDKGGRSEACLLADAHGTMARVLEHDLQSPEQLWLRRGVRYNPERGPGCRFHRPRG